MGEANLDSPTEGGGVDELESVTLLLALSPELSFVIAESPEATLPVLLLLVLFRRSSKSDSGRFLAGRPRFFISPVLMGAANQSQT